MEWRQRCERRYVVIKIELTEVVHCLLIQHHMWLWHLKSNVLQNKSATSFLFLLPSPCVLPTLFDTLCFSCWALTLKQTQDCLRDSARAEGDNGLYWGRENVFCSRQTWSDLLCLWYSNDVKPRVWSLKGWIYGYISSWHSKTSAR